MAKTERIKILMWRRRISGAEIARRVKRSQQMVSFVILGQRKSRRVEDGIAKALDVPVQSLFPYRARKAS